MDKDTKQLLYQLSDILEDAVDKLAVKRDAASQDEKYLHRYIAKKVQNAAINVRMSIDKFEARV